jgi:putative membrane protein
MAEAEHSAASRPATELRDRLAVDRTVLALERTFLSYTRTALALFGFGITFIYVPLFDNLLFLLLGFLSIPLAVGTFLAGLWKYRNGKKRLSAGH